MLDHGFRLINLIADEMGLAIEALLKGIGQETAQQGREPFCLPSLSFQENTKQLRKLSRTASASSSAFSCGFPPAPLRFLPVLQGGFSRALQIRPQPYQCALLA